MCMWIFERIFQIIFPSSCFICKKESVSLCKVCISSLSKSIYTPPLWMHITYHYKDDNVRKCLHAIKYYHRKDLVVPIVSATIDEDLMSFVGNVSNMLLVPIPMHRKRLWSRGHNHALHIAKAYGEALRIPVENNLLARNKNSPQQAKLHHKQERKENVRNIFSVNRHRFDTNKTNIVLIDDTTTTHATLLEAKKVLERSGFVSVRALVLAH